MIAVACRVLHSPRDAEDVVHDVFLEAWHRARHYDPERGSVQTWLMMRLRSRALDRLRSARRRADLAARAAEAESLDGPSLVDTGGAPSDAQELRGLLSSLGTDQRHVLELAYFEGLPLADIAERLSLPLGTVKSRLSRAVSELRARLHPQEKA